jgi:hypothetical protein
MAKSKKPKFQVDQVVMRIRYEQYFKIRWIQEHRGFSQCEFWYYDEGGDWTAENRIRSLTAREIGPRREEKSK